MAIPTLTPEGVLPIGLHDCTFDEIVARFGQYEGSDQRPRLCERFKSMLDDVRLSPLFEAVIVDGSFVTAKPDPGDIDLVLVLKAGHDWKAGVRPFEYNLLSKRHARKMRGFDVWPAEMGTAVYQEAVAFFEQVKGRPGQRKGLLQVSK